MDLALPPQAVNALNVIAIALSIQTFLMVAGGVAAFVMWRRATLSLDRRFDSVEGRLDVALREACSAAQAVSRVSRQASGFLDGAHGALEGAHGAIRSLVSLASSPRALLAAGAASAASSLLSTWRRARRRVA
jgi:hypothetical protein